MYIITQSDGIENSKNNIIWVRAVEIEKQYTKPGYQRSERTYKIEVQGKVYTVVCPEYRDKKNGDGTVVIVPEFHVPGRPYPAYVYLYAIELYSNAPEKGQRWAAEETRKYFGLETFAHTTLGRAMKAFIGAIGAETEADAKAMGNGGVARNIPTVGTTAAARRQAAEYLSKMPGWGNRRKAIEARCELAGDYFRRNRRFIL